MNDILNIIHKIWSGIEEPLPEHFRQFAETWKACHHDWEYQLWDNDRMNTFIGDHYPTYWDTYLSFQYNIQRWDAIRYLILDKIGGMYVDFDIECLRPHDSLIQGHTCCFSSEPESHRRNANKQVYFNRNLLSYLSHFQRERR